MIRSHVPFSCSRSISIIIPTALALIFLSLTSCSSYDFEITPHQQDQQLHEVTVSLTGINFTLNPATRATPTEAGITHIALKVFDSTGKAVADTCQIASKLTQGFNQLGVQLPAGTYTFVAVAHDTSADNISCATITSPEVVTLPEGIIPTLYAHVQQVAIANANNQSVTIDMGKRINATLHLTSADIVPDGVSRMAVDLNSKGSTVGANNLPQINPSTGFSIGNYRFARALPVTAGEPIDVSMNLLLPADTYSYPVTIHAQDVSNKNIPDYDRPFASVPFQRAYITNASGQYFRYVSNSSLNFDTTTDSHEFAY